MWKLHHKNIRLTLNDIKSEKIFLVIWKKGICFMSTDGLFRRYLTAFGYGGPPPHDPSICLLATKSELLRADLITLQEELVSAGVLSNHLPIPVSLAVYDRKIDILCPDRKEAIAEIMSSITNAARERERGKVLLHKTPVLKLSREQTKSGVPS